MNSVWGKVLLVCKVGLLAAVMLLAASHPAQAADEGYAWTSRTAAGSRKWQGITSSANGQKLVTAAENGSIYTSTDAGVTWTEQTSAGARQWVDLASSPDGTKVVGAVYNGQIWTSNDSGVTWSLKASSPTTNWFAIDVSADGTKIVAVMPARPA